MRISDWSSDVCSSDLVFVAIRSVAFISPNVAQVRFIKRLQRDQQVIETPAIATITFDVLSKPETESGRYANPLGFQVTTYRARSEERRVGKECVRTCRFGWWPEH